jgi:tetratricopeptide (TPR) repeat protein
MMPDLVKMMAQLPRITGLLLALGAVQALAADPVLPPASDWGATVVHWERQGGRVLGRATGGECGFAGDVPTVVASWAGDLLVGTVRVCEKGPGCSEQALPLFAFFNPDDGSLTAELALDRGCTSPLVKTGGRVLLIPHVEGAAELEPRVQREGHGRKSHLELGNDYLRRVNGRRALAEFERALQAGEDSFTAYLGRGEAQMMLQRPQSALRDYRRALAIKPDGLAYYNLACVQSRLSEPTDALESLKRAVQHGFTDRVKVLRDPDLAAVRELPAFQRVLAQMQAMSGG